MIEILQWLFAIFIGAPILLAAAIVIVGGTFEILQATLFSLVAIIVFGEYRD